MAAHVYETLAGSLVEMAAHVYDRGLAAVRSLSCQIRNGNSCGGVWHSQRHASTASITALITTVTDRHSENHSVYSLHSENHSVYSLHKYRSRLVRSEAGPQNAHHTTLTLLLAVALSLQDPTPCA